MIQMIRVDYRLLHGQVAVSWTSALGADCILLVSDTVLNDKLRLQALSLAKPEGCKVVVKNTADAVKALQSGVTDKYKLFVVLRDDPAGRCRRQGDGSQEDQPRQRCL